MSSLQSFYFVFTILLFHLVRSNEVCDFADIQCWTKGVQYLYKTIVNGGEGLVTPMEPLNVVDFKTEVVGVLRAEANNVTFSGLDKCSPILLKFLENEYKYDYILRCPKLNLRATVGASGYIGSVYINGHDFVTITAVEYLVKVRGKYGVFIAEDHSSRFYLEDFIMDTDPQGYITLNTKTNFGLPEKLSSQVESYLKKNWRLLEKELRYPAMQLFMGAIVKEGDIYLRATPRSDIFPKTENSCTCNFTSS